MKLHRKPAINAFSSIAGIFNDLSMVVIVAQIKILNDDKSAIREKMEVLELNTYKLFNLVKMHRLKQQLKIIDLKIAQLSVQLFRLDQSIDPWAILYNPWVELYKPRPYKHRRSYTTVNTPPTSFS
ncbi:MAG: hypothetical protein KGI91_12210 [Burkholderiales bacterium]|nr:hypothetical protein [Burkholderiales bacterium]